VKLSETDVVQPDILVVCDLGQIRTTHIEGAPALVIEILSPDSTRHDRARKPILYAKAGVKEFWIVTPWPSLAEVFVLDGESYRMQAAFGKDDELRSVVFPDLRIDLRDVFDFPLEREEQPRVVKESPAAYPYDKPAL
jgi:Uma2 family endonuclease